MKKTIYIICLFLLNFGCSKSGDDNEPETSTNPSTANLVFPYENSLCNEGTNVTPTESTVLFEWQASENTDSYTLVIKNISTGNTTTYQTTNIELSVTIARATQHQWYVISNSNTVEESTQSEIWLFYNSGEGVQSYAPFPAAIISPAMAEIIDPSVSQITLSWTGSDVDDDIVGYDVYFGTTTTPEIYTSDQVDSNLNNVALTADTIYYWQIITKDSQGNTSSSGIFQFKNL